MYYICDWILHDVIWLIVLDNLHLSLSNSPHFNVLKRLLLVSSIIQYRLYEKNSVVFCIYPTSPFHPNKQVILIEFDIFFYKTFHIWSKIFGTDYNMHIFFHFSCSTYDWVLVSRIKLPIQSEIVFVNRTHVIAYCDIDALYNYKIR
jgi:hypothetical protein